MFKGHGGNIKPFLNPGNSSILDFSASINPLGYPEKVKKTVMDNFDDILHYPDIDCASLKKYLSRKIGHAEEEIIVGNGSTELFYLIPRALRPAKGIIFQPTFSEFAEALKCSCTEVINHVLKEKDGFGFRYCEDVFQDQKIGIVFLCNPNNPTGQLIQKDTIVKMAKQHPDIIFVVDEAFVDFLDSPEKYSVIDDVGAMGNLIVVRSLTKFYGFPGIRIGYLAAHADLIKKMVEYKEPWSVNALAQHAAMAAMEDDEFISRSREFMFRERLFLFHELSAIDGLLPYEPTANYIFVKIKQDTMTSLSLCKRLIEDGIAIRDCSNFLGLDNSYFRVAVRTRAENIRLIEALKKIVVGKSITAGFLVN
ncbi:MAG: threonine-phosphate decarboxylase CobD [Candidatus Brocadiaceae bacterium]|nr:threonine-phosphate decarboxylase CobD [Candidatus Brocadiaceae bacterium]